MTRWEVDMACGQTPCLCGDIDTSHPQCYAGKTYTEIRAAYELAYRIARRKLRERAKEKAHEAIMAIVGRRNA